MISDQEFDKVCRLAKLAVSDASKKDFLNKLNSVFGWMDQLAKIDTSSVDNTVSDCVATIVERKDIAHLDNTKDELLSNTKNKKFDMFCVPKIVE